VPLPPIPRPRRARAAGGPRFDRAPARAAHTQPPAPGPLGIEAQIAWRPGAGDAAFELRPLDAAADEGLPRVPIPSASADAPPERTGEASRAHALLYDRLVLDGWEPVGRGERWYAHRFRRTAAPAREAVSVTAAGHAPGAAAGHESNSEHTD
jgi:hypothetical protein